MAFWHFIAKLGTFTTCKSAFQVLLTSYTCSNFQLPSPNTGGGHLGCYPLYMINPDGDLYPMSLGQENLNLATCLFTSLKCPPNEWKHRHYIEIQQQSLFYFSWMMKDVMLRRDETIQTKNDTKHSREIYHTQDLLLSTWGIQNGQIAPLEPLAEMPPSDEVRLQIKHWTSASLHSKHVYKHQSKFPILEFARITKQMHAHSSKLSK